MRTQLINKKAVREFMLDEAKRSRAHAFTRVKEQTLVDCSEAVRQWCIHRVRTHPSVGKTL